MLDNILFFLLGGFSATTYFLLSRNTKKEVAVPQWQPLPAALPEPFDEEAEMYRGWGLDTKQIQAIKAAPDTQHVPRIRAITRALG